MIFSLRDKSIISDNCYKVIHKDNVVCYFRGFLYCIKNKSGSKGIDVLINQYIENKKVNFDEFYGAYHVILLDMLSNKVIFFADNAGQCCFYYNMEKGMISDSFLQLSSAIEYISPNYEAITQFIHLDCIYGNNTICNEVLRTDAMYYYVFDNYNFIIKRKVLNIWERECKYQNLHDFMADMIFAAKDLKAVNIITGGTDSRTVLSHMISLGTKFELAISGDSEMVDVQIAKKIADRLNIKIYISDEKVNVADKGWLKKLFISTDGVTGTFSRYRLHKKNLMLKQLGMELELGGVGGELYKNSFLNQDFPFYNSGEINKRKFYKLKINPSNFGTRYLTDRILNCLNHMEQKVTEELFSNEHGQKKNVYFRIGSKILRYRMVTLTNSNNLSISSVSPFVEIDMMKLTYNKNPWTLEMNKWQRNEVSKYCPEIADIKTDRGLTLNNSKKQIFKEIILSYKFLIQMGLKRILFMKIQKQSTEKLDIYIKGRELKEFTMAINKCIELDILKMDIDIDQIPDNLADKLMTIGLVFMNY